MTYLLYILLALVILLAMVTIHEFGHYTAGRLLGFEIDEFAVGFGVKLLSRRSKRTGILWSLRLLPLGGYCAFAGEDISDDDNELKEKTKTEIKPDAETKTESRNETIANADLNITSTQNNKAIAIPKNGNGLKFGEQKPYRRILVLLAGVFFNFISAIIFSLIYIAVVGSPTIEVSKLYLDESGSPYAIGLQEGDIIAKVGGREISVMNSFYELDSSVKDGDTVILTVKRDDKSFTVPVKKQEITVTDESGKITKYYGYGITSSSVYLPSSGADAFKYCIPYTGKLSWAVIGAFGDLITGQIPVTSLTGPIGTVDYIARVSIANWRNILLLLPLIASNLAIFNLLPIPALDGSKVIFTIIEWIRKKPINKKVEYIIDVASMVLMFGFVIVIDIISLVAR